jgi:hypothetical protein
LKRIADHIESIATSAPFTAALPFGKTKLALRLDFRVP